MATNGLGLPLAIEPTGGEGSDDRGFDLVFDGERPLPELLIAGRGYDGERIREDVEAAGGSTLVPGRQNRTQTVPMDRFAYRLRNRIERTLNRMNNARRTATRYDQTAASHLRFVQVEAIRLWTRHVVDAA